MDDYDLKILEILKDDAKKPFTEIATKLGISDSTVHMRVNKMMKGGIINKFTISIRPEALGKVECIIMLSVQPGCFEKILPALCDDQCVEEILELHSEVDAMLKLSANSLSEIREKITEIGKLPNVTRITMSPILGVWKGR